MREILPYLCLGGLILFVVGLFASLLIPAEEWRRRGEVFSKALTSGQKGRQQQDADLDELRRRVADLETKSRPQPDETDSSSG